MCLLRRVDHHPADVTAGSFPGHDKRRVGRVGRAHLDDTATRTGGLPSLWQAEQINQPVGNNLLDFGRSRTRRPQHALHTETGRDQFAEDRRRRGVRGEVAEPPRRLPMCDPRHHDRVEIPQHRFERLRLLGSRRRELRPDRSRFDGRNHRAIRDRFHVVGDPLNDVMPIPPKLVRRHVIRVTSPRSLSSSAVSVHGLMSHVSCLMSLSCYLLLGYWLSRRCFSSSLTMNAVAPHSVPSSNS